MFINFAKNGDYYAMKHLELGFVGFGLIGGSIARSLKKQNEDVSVHVYSRRKNPALDEGMTEGVIDSIWYEIDERFSTCDIIFLCAPVLKNTDYLSVLKPLLKPGCILTDLAASLSADTQWPVPKKRGSKIPLIFCWKMHTIY